MGAKLLISSVGDHRYIGLLQNGKLSSFMVAPPKRTAISGNIYLGRVAKILPGMNSVFVHCDLERTACLYAEHLVPESDDPLNKRVLDGQSLITQVTREPMGKKGARLSMKTSIVGRFIVLTPTFSTRAISRRITDKQERKRLEELSNAVVCTAGGFIVRTQAYGCSIDDLQDDVNRLTENWNAIEQQSKTAKKPGLLHQEVDAVLAMIRDHLPTNAEAIVVDSASEKDRIERHLKQWMPSLVDKLKLHDVPGRLFADYRVETDLRRILKRNVQLKCGGFLSFDHTEAMTVIDVNTGKFVGKDNVADTILATNLEAADAIGKQLKLRNIAGLVVIDFIDMANPSHRRQVTQRVQQSLSTDSARIKVLPMNDLGLISLSRERIGQPVVEIFRQNCASCGGQGWTDNINELCRRIVSDTQSLIQTRNDLTGVCIRSNNDVLEILNSTFKNMLNAIQTREGLELTTERTETTLRDGFEIVGRYG